VLLFYLLGHVVLYVSVQAIQQQTLAQKSRQDKAWFSRQHLMSFMKEVGHTQGKAQLHVLGTFFEVPFSSNMYSCTDCGMGFKAVLWWDSFVL
jgi:hypothetical protein